MSDVQQRVADQEKRVLDLRLLRFRSNPKSEQPIPLANELMRAGRYGDARGVLVSAHQGDEHDVELLLLEANAWFVERDFERAQAVLQQALKGHPKRVAVYLALGELMLKRGDPNRALSAFEKGLLLEPSNQRLKELQSRAHRLSVLVEDDRYRKAGDAHSEMVESDHLPAFDQRLFIAPNSPLESTPPSEPALGAADAFTDQPPSNEPADKDDIPPEALAAESLEPEPIETEAPVAPEPIRFKEPFPLAQSAPPPPPEPYLAESEQESKNESLPDSFISSAVSSSELEAAAGNKETLGLERDGPIQRDSAEYEEEPIVAARDEKEQQTAWVEIGTVDVPSLDSRVVRSEISETRRFEPLTETEPPEPSESAKSQEPESIGSEQYSADIDAQPATEPKKSESERESSGGDEQHDVRCADAEADASREREASEPSATPRDEPVVEIVMNETADGVEDAPHEPVSPGDSMATFDEPTDRIEDTPPKPASVCDSIAPLELSRKARKPRRLGAFLALSIAVGSMLVAGGFFGWEQYQKTRRARALQLVSTADRALFSGDSGAIAEAEAYLRRAASELGTCPTLARSLLLTSLYRALEEGRAELGALRIARQSAEKERVDRYLLKTASALERLLSGDANEANELLGSVRPQGAIDPALLDILGRIAARLGSGEAEVYFLAALERDPRLVSAALALARLRRDRDQRDQALELVESVLQREKEHLRARLIKLDILADLEQPARLVAELNRLKPVLQRGRKLDRLREMLVRARLLRRQGETEEADRLFLSALGSAEGDAPRLGEVARSAFRAQRLAPAKTAASRAVDLSAETPVYRRLLAEVLFARHDLEAAFEALAPLPESDPYRLIANTHAALGGEATEAVQTALAALDAYRATAATASIELETARIRARTMLGADQALLETASTLAARAPGDPRALRAWGETALAMQKVKEATRVFTELVSVAPDDADNRYLLGRCLWLSADAEGAEGSFRRALEIEPEHSNARLALGDLMLEQNDHVEADRLFRGLCESAKGSTEGCIGRARALVGLGKLKQAQAQLEALSPRVRDSDRARVAEARLALAWNRPVDALTRLMPLTESSSVTASQLILFGDAAYAAGRIDVAGRAYNRALKQGPELPRALLGAALVAIRAGYPDKALAALASALQTLEKENRAPELRARVLTAMGHAHVQKANGGTSERAYNVLREATEIKSVPVEAFFWLGESVAGIRATEARAAYERYLEQEPKGRYAERAKRALASRAKPKI
ncbi:MAG: tetratricopeptide repeat protein [Deltaproteobacteria bacterium]|nr:tetratricopeptide repeat protein [Deltaproteobacteria bacterium]